MADLPRMSDHEILLRIDVVRGEVKVGFTNITDRLDGLCRDLASVKQQTTATNGRLRRVELNIAMLKGALALLGIVTASGAGWYALLTRGG